MLGKECIRGLHFLEKRPADFPNSVSEDLPKDFLEKIEKKNIFLNQ